MANKRYESNREDILMKIWDATKALAEDSGADIFGMLRSGEPHHGDNYVLSIVHDDHCPRDTMKIGRRKIFIGGKVPMEYSVSIMVEESIVVKTGRIGLDQVLK